MEHASCLSTCVTPFSFLCFQKGTREAAFVYALSAATISHTIARACTSGDLRLCTCGPIPAEIPEPGYRWGGCADNLHYGLMTGSKFSDAPMKMKRSGSHANKLMHLHNSEVGRQVMTLDITIHLVHSRSDKVGREVLSYVHTRHVSHVQQNF